MFPSPRIGDIAPGAADRPTAPDGHVGLAREHGVEQAATRSAG